MLLYGWDVRRMYHGVSNVFSVDNDQSSSYACKHTPYLSYMMLATSYNTTDLFSRAGVLCVIRYTG